MNNRFKIKKKMKSKMSFLRKAIKELHVLRREYIEQKKFSVGDRGGEKGQNKISENNIFFEKQRLMVSINKVFI